MIRSSRVTMESQTPINLHSHARQNFLEWRSSIIEAYGQSCNIYYRHGLLGYLLTDADWALLPGNTVTEEPVDNLPAVVIIAARPTLPEFTPLAAAATTAQQSAWDRNTKILKYTRENYDTLKLRLACRPTTSRFYVTQRQHFSMSPHKPLWHISQLFMGHWITTTMHS